MEVQKYRSPEVQKYGHYMSKIIYYRITRGFYT